MGVNCTICINSKISQSAISVDTKHFETNYTNQIIKIQSTFRGHNYRKKSLTSSFIQKYHNQLKYQNKKNQYIITTSSNISDTQIETLFQTYPPLNDKIELKLIKLLFPNIGEYSGEWNPEKKERHGRGIQLWNDKSIYMGLWKNDKINGKGKLIDPMGDYYEGDFINDNAEGYGSYIHKEGPSYIGMWKNNRQDGKGKEIWPDKTEYEGDYKKGEKWGKGKLKLNDGSYYIGDFYHNQIHGKGKYYWYDNKRYEGEWKNNKMDGEGEFYWPDGKVYIGHYLQDEKSGFGELRWPNGKIYKGLWKNGKQHGEGEMFNPKDNAWKKGFWNEGKRVRWSIHS